MKRTLLLMMLLIFATISNSFVIAGEISQKVTPNIFVEVDLRVELVEIIFYFTDWEKMRGFPTGYEQGYQYLEDISNYFSNYKFHRAVKLAQKAFESGMGYDAIPYFALFLDKETFEKAKPWDDYIISRVGGNVTLLNELAEAVKDFAEESNFWEFYERHKHLYERTINSYLSSVNLENITKTEEEFFGENVKEWHVVLQFAQWGNSYGAHFETPDGKIVYGLLGVCGITYNNTPEFCDALVHEFAHSFVNPVVEKHFDLFENYSLLYEPVWLKMEKMGYSNWKVMLDETFVRAFEAYYIHMTKGDFYARRFLAQQRALGFYFIHDIYDAYLRYSENRDRYKTFEDFMTELVEVIGGVYNRTFGDKINELENGEYVYSFMKHSKSGRIVIVYGTINPDRSGNEHDKQLAELIWRSLVHRGYNVTVRADINVTEKDLRSYLILIGGPVANNITRQVNDLLKVRFIKKDGEYVLYSEYTNRTYLSNDVGVFEIVRNPWDKRKLLTLIAGITRDGTFVPYTPDILHYCIYNEDWKEIGYLEDKMLVKVNALE
ncbi:DUF4932 domain-containing protein [Thermococcus sp. SY098]|uniref:DUF4932 domain-containing protein n=1 Tax=Thermococcus sp. SY098 TaxID=3111325 RepID=UPI002D7678BB|nr:DUF4932 domain-containing protein [Thermococcus sp. SY098]WRS51696.1 DUF4932 domain-containing protein [Thermococcus sp. SY098]